MIVGGVWVDNEGDYTLENTTTGARADLYFTPCGWFSSGRYEVLHLLLLLRTKYLWNGCCSTISVCGFVVFPTWHKLI